MKDIVTCPFDKKVQHTFAVGEDKLSPNTTIDVKRKKIKINIHQYIEGTRIAYRHRIEQASGEFIDYLLHGTVTRTPMQLALNEYLIAVIPNFTLPITKVQVIKNPDQVTTHWQSTVITLEEYQKEFPRCTNGSNDFVLTKDVLRIIKRGPETSILDQNSAITMQWCRKFNSTPFTLPSPFQSERFQVNIYKCFAYIGNNSNIRFTDMSIMTAVEDLNKAIPLNTKQLSKGQKKKYKKFLLQRKNHFLGLKKNPIVPAVGEPLLDSNG